MRWLRRVNARVQDWALAHMEVWEEAHTEPPVATGQLVLEGYSGFSAVLSVGINALLAPK